MKRVPLKKGLGGKRRKKRASLEDSQQVGCQHCSKELKGGKVLFVEEEVGRMFCSEPCITAYFKPEIHRLEKEFFCQLSAEDFSGKERENLSHLRWMTLQKPHEIWREKTLSGNFRYTLVSEFNQSSNKQNKKIWSICICLFLRGEPSFLYLAFPTKNFSMVNHYRRGEKIQWVKSTSSKSLPLEATSESPSALIISEPWVDRLADAWTVDETFLSQLRGERSEDDIPPEKFSAYQNCIEETLEHPDEVWSFKIGGKNDPFLYHFIRHYPDKDPSIWYIIVARETKEEEGEEEQIEILDTFPTQDASLVEHYRQGVQEVGCGEELRPTIRVIH